MTNLGSGRNEWDVRVGSMAGTLLKRFCTVAWAFLGLGALALYPTLANEEHAFGHLIRDRLPVGLTGLMIAAILAAMMSTCDALMLSASALLTRNIYKESFAPDRSERHYILVGRVASIAVVAVATAMAFGLGSVLDGLKHVWALLAMMGLAWWGGVIWPRATAAGAWASTIAVALAYGGTVLFNRFNDELARDLKYPEQIAIYLSCGLVALVVTSLVTTHTNPGGVRRFYRKMRTPTTVPSEFDAEE
jgi:Na+/proline symporter